MKKLLSLCVVSLLIGMTITTLSGSQSHSGKGRVRTESTQNRFIGAWRLAWLEEEGADGKIHRADCATNTAPAQYALGGYEASFGTYEIDESAHHFTFHVEGSLVRTLIDKDLTRV